MGNLKRTDVTRRQFLKQSAAVASSATLISVPGLPKNRQRLANREARYYKKLSDNKVQCELCPWQCVVEPGRRGHCEVRENRNGVYCSLVYGQIAANHNDPIEKKPFYHFLPGTSSFSIATAGCNVDCKFCQNWELAQRRPEELRSVAFTAEELVAYAERWECESIAFTYNEPTVFNEFVYDVASQARTRGIKSVIISNGFINQKPLLDLCKVIDAYKVDLKSFSEDYYRDVVGGRLAPVLETLVILKEQGVWSEIVYLTVPTLNDNASEIQDMVEWILKKLGPDIPVHFSRFYPKYKLKNLPPTPVATLEKLYNTAREAGLNHVYLGNVPGHAGENTICPKCNEIIIGRVGYRIFKNKVIDGKCDYCGQKIAGVWKT
jgi:pyruvate formate lyase activating enzyme